MANLRETLNAKPWIAWCVAGVFFVIALYMFFARMSPGGDMYNPERMLETVTIKYSDTGETEEMPRGRLIRELMLQSGNIDPSKGIINKKTGQPTGFIFDKADWEAVVKQINEDKDAAKQPRSPQNKPAGK